MSLVNKMAHIAKELMATDDRLKLGDLFTNTSHLMKISDLTPTETPHKDISQHKLDTAERLLTQKKESKRAPISVRKTENGKFEIVDGNTTFYILKKLGYKEIPVAIDNSSKSLVELRKEALKVGIPQGELDDTLDNGKVKGNSKKWLEKRIRERSASIRLGMDFHTKHEMETYKKQHPDADMSHHKLLPQTQKTNTQEPKSENKHENILKPIKPFKQEKYHPPIKPLNYVPPIKPDKYKPAIKPFVKETPILKPEEKKPEGDKIVKRRSPEQLLQDRHGYIPIPEYRNLPKKALQKNINNEQDYYNQAQEAYDSMASLLDRGSGLDKQIGAELFEMEKDNRNFRDYLKGDKPIIVIGTIKGTKRAEEKVTADYGGDWNKLTDGIRATVSVKKITDLKGIFEKLTALGMKVAQKTKDRYKKPTGVGYRDILLNVEYPNGHIGEIQINCHDVLLAKGEGHKQYEIVRSMTAEMKAAGRKRLNKKESLAVKEANLKMREIYGEAYKKTIGENSENG